MVRPKPSQLADLLGVPFLPPPLLTRVVKRVHATARRIRSDAVPPPAQIMESLFGILDHRGLTLLCESGVVDALDRPTSAEELASTLRLDPDRLALFLRLGVARGWIAQDRQGRFRPNRVTEFLRRDHPGGWRAQVDLLGGSELIDSIRSLSLDIEPQHVFERVHGEPYQQWLTSHPERWEVFDRAQSVGGRVHGYTLARAWDWEGVSTVCDVGGGTGALLVTLLDLQPHLRGVLLDLPPVVARAPHHLRLEIIGADAFEGVPAGHDVYLLVNILHMWGDGDVTHILRRVAAACEPNTKVLVVESRRDDVPRADMTPYLDVVMEALTDGGVERGQKALDALARAAGLRLAGKTALGTGDVAYELRLADVSNSATLAGRKLDSAGVPYQRAACRHADSSPGR